MRHLIVSIIIVTNITIHVYLFKSLPIILSNIYSPRTGTAESYDGNSLTFWETAKSLSTVPAPSSFSNAGLQFLYTTTTICNSSHQPFLCLGKGHPNPNVTFTGFLKNTVRRCCWLSVSASVTPWTVTRHAPLWNFPAFFPSPRPPRPHSLLIYNSFLWIPIIIFLPCHSNFFSKISFINLKDQSKKTHTELPWW